RVLFRSLFPFSVGGATALFPEAATADVLFQKIARFRPTILINVPTMINQMVSHPAASEQDLSCVRLATSAGEALPADLYDRWKQTFGVELLDGLGTAEMWHIFISNRPGHVRPGTLGTVVPGFEVKVCDDAGRELPNGEMGSSRPASSHTLDRKSTRLNSSHDQTSYAAFSLKKQTATRRS